MVLIKCVLDPRRGHVGINQPFMPSLSPPPPNATIRFVSRKSFSQDSHTVFKAILRKYIYIYLKCIFQYLDVNIKCQYCYCFELFFFFLIVTKLHCCIKVYRTEFYWGGHRVKLQFVKRPVGGLHVYTVKYNCTFSLQVNSVSRWNVVSNATWQLVEIKKWAFHVPKIISKFTGTVLHFQLARK